MTTTFDDEDDDYGGVDVVVVVDDGGTLNHQHCGLCVMTEEDCGDYYYLFDYYCYCCKCDSSD